MNKIEAFPPLSKSDSEANERNEKNKKSHFLHNTAYFYCISITVF